SASSEFLPAFGLSASGVAGCAGEGGASPSAGAAEPELVSLILNRLKSQGLFDQFRRDCLADVDTKPAYQNLRQRVDNFVSNHLATHTWILQTVLLYESGIDRIISQVVDPKINHIFRPQVEKAVHEFLATMNHQEETNPSFALPEEKLEPSISPAPKILLGGSASRIVGS
uniref:BOD1/SHG1 domain-containing protein n=1 Tax=Naja naja TaxID=35670 RepID=A0A8C6VFV8_NAJNA